MIWFGLVVGIWMGAFAMFCLCDFREDVRWWRGFEAREQEREKNRCSSYDD